MGRVSPHGAVQVFTCFRERGWRTECPVRLRKADAELIGLRAPRPSRTATRRSYSARPDLVRAARKTSSRNACCGGQFTRPVDESSRANADPNELPWLQVERRVLAQR